MNKYQDYAIKFGLKLDYERNDKSLSLSSLDFDFRSINVVQNENYNVKEYNLYLLISIAEKIECIYNDNIILAKSFGSDKYLVKLDFDNKVERIKIYFKDNIVDPIDLPITFVDADKEKYDQKLLEEHKKSLIEKANVKVTTGDSVINVTFQPVLDSFNYSKVELFKITGTKVVNGKNVYDYQLMAKYKTESEVYFHSITGLAYDHYAIILIQYDNSNNEIYRSEHIQVNLKEPLGRKRWVVGPNGGRYI